MTDLTEKKCESCEGKMNPMPLVEVNKYLVQVPNWKLSNDAKGIYREYVMKNFLAAVLFIEKIAKVAEAENHHPDLHLTSYRKLRVELSTHAIGGLSENDFIEAAKINELLADLKK